MIEKFFKKWYALALEFVVVLCSGYLIWNHDKFQETLAPEKYWNGRIYSLGKDLKKDQWRLRSIEIAMEKEKLSGDFEMKEAVEKAEVFGEDADAIAQHASNVLHSKLSNMERDRQAAKEVIEKKQVLLDAAKQKLESLPR